MLVGAFHNVILQSCSYCIYDEELLFGYIIDVGDVPQIIDFVKKKKIKIEGLLLTHPHFDHIYGINELIKTYPLLKIYCSEESYNGIKDGRGSLAELYVEDFQIPPDSHFVVFDNNTKELDLQFKIQLLFTPGHDTGCVCYIIDGKIFTGDSYIPYAPVTYLWPRSSKEEALINEEIIKELINKQSLEVYPGHYR